MWTIWDRGEAAPLPIKLRLELIKQRGLTWEAAAALRMTWSRGRQAGRSVTRFVVFDPATTGSSGPDVCHPGDLAPGSVLHAGHFERDGEIKLHQTAHAAAAGTTGQPARDRAESWIEEHA